MSEPSKAPAPGKLDALRLPLGLSAFPVAFVSAFLGIFAIPGTPDSPLTVIFPVYLYLLPAALIAGGIGCLLPVPPVQRVAVLVVLIAMAVALAPIAFVFGLVFLDGVSG